jgi:hypothetical protein
LDETLEFIIAHGPSVLAVDCIVPVHELLPVLAEARRQLESNTIRTVDWLRWKERAKTAGRAGRVNSEYLMHISSHAKTIDESRVRRDSGNADAARTLGATA